MAETAAGTFGSRSLGAVGCFAMWQCTDSIGSDALNGRQPVNSVVAEKFEAIVKLGMANSRMKDFYDLWVLAQKFQFESATLAAAIQAFHCVCLLGSL